MIPEDASDFLNKIRELVATSARTLRNLRIPAFFEKVKPTKARTKHPGSKNHSKKRDKKRAKIAAASQKINRNRFKHWKST